MKTSNFGRVSALTVSLALFGCQSTGGSALGPSGGGDGDPCNPVVGAVVGGVIGAVIGKGDRRVQGAAIGAGLGALACVGINALSRQTKSAEQVEADYRRQNSGKLPPSSPVVQAYNVKVNPDLRVKGGEKVRVVSNMTVVSGSSQPVNEVTEVLTLKGPDGTKTAQKKANERPGSGAYENTFNLSFPKDVAPGTYPIKTQLLVNGQQASERNQNLVIVAEGSDRRFMLVSR